MMMMTSGLSYLLVVALALVDSASSFGIGGNRVFVSTPVSNHPKKRVSDCMTQVPTVLTPQMSIDDTIRTLLEHGLSGAPVVDDNNKLLGIVTSSDFLEKEAFEGALLPMEGTSETVQMYVEAAKKICGQKVEEVMTCNPVTVHTDMTMRAAAKLMAEKNLHRLPVVDGDNVLVGILSSADVMRDLLQVVRELKAAEDTEDSGFTP